MRLRLLVLLLIALGGEQAVGVGEPRKPEDNAALWYWRCFNELQVEADSSKRYIAILRKEAQAENVQEVEALRSDWQRVIETAVVAASKPYCVFGIDRDQGMEAMLPHLEPMRRLARMISGEVDAAIDRGDLCTAVQHIDTLCAMAAHTMQDGLQISALVAISIATMAFERTRLLLEANALDEALKMSLHTPILKTSAIAMSALPEVLQVEREMTSLNMLQRWDGPEYFDEAVQLFKEFGADPIALLTPDQLVKDLRRFDAQLVRLIAAAKEGDAERMKILTSDARELKHGVVAGLLIVPYEKSFEQLRQVEEQRTMLLSQLAQSSATTQPTTP